MSCVVSELPTIGHPDRFPLGRHDAKAERLKRRVGAIHLESEVTDHEIDIVMATGLVAEQRVDAPPTSQPTSHPRFLYRPHGAHDVVLRHLSEHEGTEGREQSKR